MMRSVLICGLFIAFLVYQASCNRVARDDAAPKLRAWTLEEPPYVKRQGSDITGYIPDLLEAISDTQKLLFDLRLLPDNTYGIYDQSRRTWNGLMGQLTTGQADVIAAPMTVSPERERAVDFTDHFMDVYLTILLLKPEQGGPATINDPAELANDPTMQYGCVRDGYTFNFFKTATSDTLSKMWRHMDSNPSNLMDTVQAGVDKVRSSKGKYAFIIESPMAEYHMNNGECDLRTTSVRIGGAKYALAVQKQSQYLEPLNEAIEELKVRGTLDRLRKKWLGGNCNQPLNRGANNMATGFSLVTMLVSMAALAAVIGM